MSVDVSVPGWGPFHALCVTLLCLFLSSTINAQDCSQIPERQLFDVEARGDEQEPDWLSLYLECLPPLQNPLNGRLPLILWRGVGSEPLATDKIQALLARGLVPHLPLSPAAIPAALAIQTAGAPVILMEGRNSSWPYRLLGDDRSWQLEVKAPERLPAQWRVQPDPTRLDAWALGAEEIRATLRAFKQAGVEVEAVWLDFEGQPLMLDYQTVLASPVAKDLPKEALADGAAFARFRRQLWAQLMSAYVAGPIREVYPDVSVTNWIITLSSQGMPVLSWDNWPHPDLSASLFTATNPIAYGIDRAFWSLWPKGQVPERPAVDRLYLHVLLRQVSADAWNRSYRAPYLQSVPWVARWVRELGDRETPMMSREAYREALHHLWLRGIDGMQVFNPYRKGRLAQTLSGAVDALAVYDELLAYPELLAQGQVMSYQVPGPGENTILWSGLRDDARALVRVVRLGEGPKLLHLEAWPGERVLLPAMSRGASFLLTRTQGQIEVKLLP